MKVTSNRLILVTIVSLALLPALSHGENNFVYERPSGCVPFLLIQKSIGCDSQPILLAARSTKSVRLKKKTRRVRKKRKRPVENTASSVKTFGVGLNLGWEAPYGNGLSGHYYLNRYFEANAGAGYNFYNGLRFGAGATGHMPLGDSFGLSGSLVAAMTSGSSGQVSFDANYTPQGSSASRAVQVSKDFTVSGATILNLGLGAYFNFGGSFRLYGQGTYGVVVAGNEVELDNELAYDQPINVTNEDSFDPEFNRKAEEKIKAGGLGFTAGVQWMI